MKMREESELVVSEKHRVYVGEEEKNLDIEPFFVNQVMMVEVLKNNLVFFEPENKNETSDLNSFKRAQVMPEVFEMLNRNAVTGDNLLNLFIESNSEIFVFPFEFFNNLPQFFRDFKFEGHLICINLSNPSAVMGKCSPSAIALSFFAYSSLTSNSSIGYQSILSQNSRSSSDSSPVLMNLSNISCFINLTTALAKNSESNFSLCLINSSILIDNIENHDYLSFSIEKNLSGFRLQKITETRYPDAGNREYTKQEAEEGIKIAENIIKWAVEKLS